MGNVSQLSVCGVKQLDNCWMEKCVDDSKRTSIQMVVIVEANELTPVWFEDDEHQLGSLFILK